MIHTTGMVCYPFARARGQCFLSGGTDDIRAIERECEAFGSRNPTLYSLYTIYARYISLVQLTNQCLVLLYNTAAREREVRLVNMTRKPFVLNNYARKSFNSITLLFCCKKKNKENIISDIVYKKKKKVFVKGVSLFLKNK